MSQNSWRMIYFDLWTHEAGRTMVEQAPDIEMVRLERALPAEDIWPQIAEIHGYQIGSARQELPQHLHGTAEFLARCPNLLAISADGAGVDTLDIDACTQAGVIVVNQSGGNREGVAEHALALMLSLAKRIGETEHALRRDRNWHRNDYLGNDILGKTVGIIGLGNVGSRLASICRTAFDMRVLAYDPYLTDADFHERNAEKASLEDLLATSDFVQICCPYTAETMGMVGEHALSLMASHAYLVSTARGGIHDEKALEKALRDGRIRGAGMDVWEDEPPPLDHPLLAFDTVIASPHTAGVTEESRRNMSVICAEQWFSICRGQRPPRLLNPDVWPRYQARFAEQFGAQAAE